MPRISYKLWRIGMFRTSIRQIGEYVQRIMNVLKKILTSEKNELLCPQTRSNLRRLYKETRDINFEVEKLSTKLVAAVEAQYGGLCLETILDMPLQSQMVTRINNYVDAVDGIRMTAYSLLNACSDEFKTLLNGDGEAARLNNGEYRIISHPDSMVYKMCRCTVCCKTKAYKKAVQDDKTLPVSTTMPCPESRRRFRMALKSTGGTLRRQPSEQEESSIASITARNEDTSGGDGLERLPQHTCGGETAQPGPSGTQTQPMEIELTTPETLNKTIDLTDSSEEGGAEMEDDDGDSIILLEVRMHEEVVSVEEGVDVVEGDEVRSVYNSNSEEEDAEEDLEDKETGTKAKISERKA